MSTRLFIDKVRAIRPNPSMSLLTLATTKKMPPWLAYMALAARFS